MNAERLGTIALIGMLVAVGAMAWWFELQPSLEVDARALGSLPARIDTWESLDVPLEDDVTQELRADFNLQRVYCCSGDAPVWLYVGYYGTARGGRPAHTPRGCYTGAGWGIESTRTVDIARDTGLRANEYLVERAGERRMVHFWFRSRRRTGMLGGFDQNWDRLMGRLVEGRADGALVRVSTPLVDGDEIAARSRLMSFASALDPLLEDRWPSEHRAGAKSQKAAVNPQASPELWPEECARYGSCSLAGHADQPLQIRPAPLPERRLRFP